MSLPGSAVVWRLHFAKLAVTFATPWVDEADFADTVDALYDANGDDSVCMKTMWSDLNPNSKWSGVLQFLLRDNNSGT